MNNPEISRRSLLRTAAWSAPAVGIAAAAPAYATSNPKTPPHKCDPKKCKPKVTCRKVKHPSKATWWEYKAEKTCPFSDLGIAVYFDKTYRTHIPVVWFPYPGSGKKYVSRVDQIAAKKR